MGKRGPCSHCGINSTPLWRNGPLNKPVLCNACGSRYKSKGNLENYLPKTVLLPPQHKNFKNDSSTGSCLWNKISTKKRSQVKNKPRIKAMEYFHEQLLSKFQKESTPEEEESVLIDNMCNFIPSNEIGLGAMLLVPDAVPTTDSGSSHVPK